MQKGNNGMKKVLFVVVLLFGLAMPAAFADGHADSEALVEKFMGLLENQMYEFTWHYEPGVEPGFYEGQAPHGAVLRTYVNNIAYDAIQHGLTELPQGSFLSKQNFTPEKVLAATTIMVKMEEGFNPDAGDWFWAKVQPDGTIDAAGAPAGCVGCHGAQKANDWLFNATLGGM